jgi:DNA-binding transcriptional MerR regulator
MKMSELEKITGTTARHVRFMISNNLMLPPSGGRSNADYDDKHIMAINQYDNLRKSGLSVQAIKDIFNGYVGLNQKIISTQQVLDNQIIEFHLSNGISVLINKNKINKDLDLDNLEKEFKEFNCS